MLSRLRQKEGFIGSCTSVKIELLNCEKGRRSGVSGTIQSVVLDMASVASLVLSVNGLSPHGEKQLLRAPEFCLFVCFFF